MIPSKTKLFISIPSLWSVRNFLYTDFVKEFSDKYDIEFLISESSEYQGIVKSTGAKYHTYPVNNYSFYERILLRALNRKLLKRSGALRKSKLVLLSMNYPRNIHGYILHFVSSFLAFFFKENFLYNIYIRIAKDKQYNNIVNEIAKYPNAIIMATNSVVKHEMTLFINLSHLKNTKINFINSFDNTTSRGFLPFLIFDKHLVWNQKMKEELSDIFFIKKSTIEIIGTPQFDLLAEGSSIKLDKNDSLYSIVEGESYIIYCAGHVSLTPYEKDIVDVILKALCTHHNDLKMVIRLHPLDQHQLWYNRFKDRKEVIFDIPWKQNENAPLLAIPNKNEYLRHGRLLKNALLVLNLGSTTSLDACVLNKPVYNIYFNAFNKNGELDLIFESEHFSPIMEFGAAPGINNSEELVKIISDIKSGNEDKQLYYKRMKLAETYCGFSVKHNFISRFDKYISDLI